ncbi:MAG: nucleotidyltransferase family protein [Alphaproteobacteria bacterium]|nr:nucleotidyltransferase family protein [Alphaproteobacteria bacterium]
MNTVQTVMILAAGRGTRMKHLTDDKPKPLITVCGNTLLGHILEKVEKQGIKNVVINTCYKGDMIKKEALKFTNLAFTFSDENEALETGGGVKNALPFLINNHGENGFFVLNADPLWDEPTLSVLSQLQAAWDPDNMDILLALVPMKQAFGDVPDGNYFIENDKPRRKKEGETNIPYLFMGIQILHPRIFKTALPNFFSLRDLYDEAQNKGRLAHIVFDGRWFHVGTPEAVEETENCFFKDN